MPRTANRGSFKKGFDPRRHQLTYEERARGYANMLAKPMPSRLRAALRRKIKRDLRGKPNKILAAHLAAHRKLCG